MIGAEALSTAFACTSGVNAHEQEALRAVFHCFVYANVEVAAVQVLRYSTSEHFIGVETCVRRAGIWYIVCPPTCADSGTAIRMQNNQITAGVVISRFLLQNRYFDGPRHLTTNCLRGKHGLPLP